MSEDSSAEKNDENDDKGENEKELSLVVHFDAGELIIKEGKEERTMYILKKGRVRVFKIYLEKKLILVFLVRSFW